VRRGDGDADDVEDWAPWLFVPQAKRSTVKTSASQPMP